jgi:hypothetical protein
MPVFGWDGALDNLVICRNGAATRRSLRSHILHRSAFLAVVFLSSACSAPIGARGIAMEYQCDVDGAETVTPAMLPSQVCAMFKEHIDIALARRTVGVKSLSDASGGEWVKVSVRITKRGSATALVSQKEGSREKSYPEIRVDVMDKALGEDELKMLAKEVGKILSDKTEG